MSDHAAPTEQERFFDVVFQDKTMKLRDKVRWLHASAGDYWTRLEAAEAQLAEQRALVEAAMAYDRACKAESVAERAWVDAAAGQTEAPRQAWLAAIEAERVASLAVLEKARAYAARQAAGGSGEGQGGE